MTVGFLEREEREYEVYMYTVLHSTWEKSSLTILSLRLGTNYCSELGTFGTRCKAMN